MIPTCSAPRAGGAVAAAIASRAMATTAAAMARRAGFGWSCRTGGMPCTLDPGGEARDGLGPALVQLARRLGADAEVAQQPVVEAVDQAVHRQPLPAVPGLLHDRRAADVRHLL